LYDDSKFLLLNTNQGNTFVPTVLSDLPKGKLEGGDFDGDGEDDAIIFDYFTPKVRVVWGLKNSSSFALGNLDSYFYQPLLI
jgi:hypothetical protein